MIASDFLSIRDFTPGEIREFIELARLIKSNPELFAESLKGKTLAASAILGLVMIAGRSPGFWYVYHGGKSRHANPQIMVQDVVVRQVQITGLFQYLTAHECGRLANAAKSQQIYQRILTGFHQVERIPLLILHFFFSSLSSSLLIDFPSSLGFLNFKLKKIPEEKRRKEVRF